MKQRHILILLAALFWNSQAGATELMQWQRLPLPVALHTGHERVIMVNRNVRVGYPAELDGKLRVQSSGGTVYLRAEEDFAPARLQLVDMDSGALILLDIRATAGDKLEPVELRYDQSVYRNDQPAVVDAPRQTAEKKARSTPPVPIPVLLTRYAAQRLYAPLRTLEPVPGVASAPPRLPATLTTLLPGEPVTASPLAAWTLGEMMVTAVRLQNTSHHRIDLDPRALQGRFLTATFQHPWLSVKGTPEDTTVLYLVTQGRADEAVVPEPVSAATGSAKKGGQ